MSQELQQGANILLPAVESITLGVGWEPEHPGGQDADPSAFLLGQDERVGGDEDFVFYNNPRSSCGSLQLSQGQAPDRQGFQIRLGTVPARVHKIAFCLTLFGRVSLAAASSLHIRVLDPEGQELASFRPPTSQMRDAASILGEVYRRNNQWKFRAVGQGFAGGLGPLARNFGVDIADDDPPSQASPSQAPPNQAKTPPATPVSRASAVGAVGVLSMAKAPTTGVLPTGSQPVQSSVAGLTYEILYRGAYALARVDLPAGRQLRAQSDAMVAMSPTVEVAGKMEGGILGGLGRMVSGESLFLQTLSATRGAGSVYFAPSSPGDIAVVELNNEAMIIQKDGFLACTEEVQVNTQLQNLAQGLFSGEGFFVVGAEGRGLLFLESYGAIHEFNLGPGEQKIVDNGYLVAWSKNMGYRLEAANIGIVAALTSGEAIVCRFTGPGKILVQTRMARQFGLWISKFLPTPSS
ncbi:TIGR00266 family protein [Thiorhodovibrio frisius]|uniref:TIGR00266 family protein n=1 Tax=Thiorhodovibrio frisius TaxID=631362 RepID=H8YX29_9GAMM|nr:TIGR00266 family protein [Thiorhodovibrio frisius]EIC23005.1 TIGR00266 family protein [Thiorhodovibrio frisius]WPL22729.1 General stress protein 16U [Thiorhodovibrio frisius]